MGQLDGRPNDITQSSDGYIATPGSKLAGGLSIRHQAFAEWIVRVIGRNDKTVKKTETLVGGDAVFFIPLDDKSIVKFQPVRRCIAGVDDAPIPRFPGRQLFVNWVQGSDGGRPIDGKIVGGNIRSGRARASPYSCWTSYFP